MAQNEMVAKGGSSGTQKSDSPGMNDNAAPGSAENPDTQTVATALPDKPTATAITAHEEQPDTFQLRDLKAQEGMAYWAVWMFAAAVLTLVVTALGTFLIWRQVILTRKAVEDTSQATEAMRKANEIAETNHRMQLRPYLFPSHASFTVDENHEPTAFVEIKNFGQSPAIDTETWYHIWVECFPLHDALPDAPDDLPKGRSIIGPGATSEISHPRGNALNEHSRNEIEAGRAALYVYGQTSYSDIFGQPHWSRFVLFASGKDALKGGRLAPYRDGNMIDRPTEDR